MDSGRFLSHYGRDFGPKSPTVCVFLLLILDRVAVYFLFFGQISLGVIVIGVLVELLWGYNVTSRYKSGISIGSLFDCYTQ